MQLVKSITLKKIKTLHCFSLTLLVLFSTAFIPVFGQDNSPYSRFGIGDLIPQSNASTRGLGGISAGFSDYRIINFSNPASYSTFYARKEERSNKISSGRALFDVGISLDNRTLKEESPARKFSASNLLFSYVQIGVPIKTNWGLSFGLRPISRISYRVFHAERLKDPVTGNPIDSATTRFEGDGGSYLASVGTGFTIFHKKKNWDEERLSLGFNAGYLFGKKDYSTRREFRNDTVQYFSGNYQTKTNFNGLHFNAGMQYRLPLSKDQRSFTFGLQGKWGQNMNATQDRIVETFQYDATLGDLRVDSVSDIKNVKGKIAMPASITAGFVLQQLPTYGQNKKGGWLLGLDFVYENWENYRFYGQQDSLKNKWELRLGGQLYPTPGANYFSNVEYRAGLILGPDYINFQNKLPQVGFTMGFGLPMPNYNRLSPNQVSILNLAFEYIKRGNKDNLLRENLFRVSVGFSFSDAWFIKRKYD
jgi:hypothetical protein